MATSPDSFRLAEGVQVLERTPATLRAMLAGLGREWLLHRDGPDAWNTLEIVAHLVNGDQTDWIPRARIILEHGTSRAFDPFDRTLGFDRAQPERLGELLDEFEQERRKSLATLKEWRLTPEKLALKGQHPALGEATLGQLLATWVAHDLTHTAQIERTLARRYRTAVGPWQAYFNTLK